MDNEIEQLKNELESLEALEKKIDIGSGDFASPQPLDKDSIYKFFREILKSEDSTKTGNLDERDLKTLRIYQGLSLFAESQNLNLISDYFFIEGEIIASTSMSKKAKFLELIVTQIKKTMGVPSVSEKAKSFWDRFKKQPTQQEE